MSLGTGSVVDQLLGDLDTSFLVTLLSMQIYSNHEFKIMKILVTVALTILKSDISCKCPQQSTSLMDILSKQNVCCLHNEPIAFHH